MDFSDNFRKLCGFSTESGNVTGNFFIRSASPITLSEERKEFLVNEKVQHILDLRRAEEVLKKPSLYAKLNGCEYINIPLIKTPYKVKSEQPLRGLEYYNRIISEKENVCLIFKYLANAKGKVIYHCAGGKSRTGVITALLLLLAGVDEEQIVQDYCRSYLELYDENVYNQKFELGKKDVKNFLDFIRKEFNNAECFFEYIGMTYEEICRLKKNLFKTI